MTLDLADTRLYDLRCRVAALQAEKLGLEIEAAARDLAEEDASAFKHCLYAFTDPIVPESALECIRQLGEWHRNDPTTDMKIILNSPGGTVFDGLGLYDYIRELVDLGHNVEIQGQGQVFSMSAVILQAASVRSMSPHSYLMIHEVSHQASGRASTMADESALLEKIQGSLVTILAGRSKLTEKEVKEKWFRRDWWMNANQALEAGFIDAIHA